MDHGDGNLGKEIHQDKDPYANIAQCGLLCAQINSLVSIMPDTFLSDQTPGIIPRGGCDLGGGYVLL